MSARNDERYDDDGGVGLEFHVLLTEKLKDDEGGDGRGDETIADG